MEKEKQSNRPLILSIISITVCVVLLIGATMAWFTDTETNTGNKIQAGTLDIDVVWYEAKPIDTDNNGKYDISYGDMEYALDFDGTAKDFEKAGSMIAEDNWEPGEVNAKLIKITNNGSLDVNIQLNAVVEDTGLQDALWYDFILVKDGKAQGNFEVRAMATLSEVVSGPVFPLGAKEGETASTLEYILIYGMLDSAGNTYQDEGYTADITVTATQASATDSVIYADNIDDIKALTDEKDADKTIILLSDITSDTVVEIPTNVNIDLNGYTLTVQSFKMENVEDICTVDITGGEIIATKGNIEILIPNGTINAVDEIFAVDEGYEVKINASLNTLNLIGSTQFLATKEDGDGAIIADTANTVSPTILANTRVVGDTDNSIELNVESGTKGVIIDNLTTSAGTLSATGEGADDVTILKDGEVVLTASEQFIADLKSAETGDTVTLTDDVEINSNLYIYGKAISINMNGFNLEINGALVLDYSEVSSLTDYTSATNFGDWVYIATGSKVISYSGGAPVFDEEQTGILTINALCVDMGSGNFSAKSASTGSITYTAYKTRSDGEQIFSAGGVMDWNNVVADGATISGFETEANKQGLLAESTITIGTPTN